MSKIVYEGQGSLFELFGNFEVDRPMKMEGVQIEDYLKRETAITDMTREVRSREIEFTENFLVALANMKGIKELADRVVLEASFYFDVAEEKLLERASAAVFRKVFSEKITALLEEVEKEPSEDGDEDALTTVFERVFQVSLPEGCYLRRLAESETPIKNLMKDCIKKDGNRDALHCVAFVNAAGETFFIALGELLRENRRGKMVGYRRKRLFYYLEDGISLIQRLIIPLWIQKRIVKRFAENQADDALVMQAVRRVVSLYDRRRKGRKLVFVKGQEKEYDFFRQAEELGFFRDKTGGNEDFLYTQGTNKAEFHYSDIGYFLVQPLCTELTCHRGGSQGKSMCAYLLALLIREAGQKTESRKYDKLLRETAAKVFQTKKNIPAFMVKAMRESSFNKVFGFVEFDESTELDKVSEMEKCFFAVNERFFGGLAHKDYELRVRKCGRYRAAGLFFPTLNCMCVDPRNSDSFCHERWHLIDHAYGNLSLKYQFTDIANTFEVTLRRALEKEKNSPEVKLLLGNTKYNLSYYLEPTEIFARCGELYLLEKGVSNSVQTEKQAFVYRAVRENRELMQLIINYFDDLTENLLKPEAKKQQAENV